jgi:hypothetical protein
MQEKPSNILKTPEGVTNLGPIQDMADAYAKAIVSLPEILTAIADELREMNGALSMLALYAEKRGTVDGIIHPDDMEDDDEGNADSGN